MIDYFLLWKASLYQTRLNNIKMEIKPDFRTAQEPLTPFVTPKNPFKKPNNF